MAKKTQGKTKAQTRKAETRSAATPPIVKPVYGKPSEAVQTLGLVGWVKARLSKPKTDGVKENMAAVKAGVMHELESLSAEKGISLTGQPFRSVVLPQVRRKRRWLWPVAAGLALATVAVIVWVGNRPTDPVVGLHKAMEAARSGDVAAFEEYVDVGALSSSVVNQVFSPQIESLPEDVRKKLQNGVGARMTAYLKPGLAEQLQAEVLTAVESGMLSLDDGNLLARMLTDMGGEAVKVGPVRVAMQDEQMSVAEVTLERQDIGLMLPLQVVMEHRGDDNVWVVTDIPNFAAVLESMQRAEVAVDKRDIEPAAGHQAPEIHVSSIHKAKGATQKDLLVTMTVTNKGELPMRNVQLNVSFGDAAGQPLKTAMLTLEGVLAPGESREQTWTVPIDYSKAMERYVMDLPLSALSVKVVPVVDAKVSTAMDVGRIG